MLAQKHYQDCLSNLCGRRPGESIKQVLEALDLKLLYNNNKLPLE